MKTCSLIVVTLAVVTLCTSVSAYARGGSYIDDFVLKNDGVAVFSENFDSGDLAGWYSATDASISSDRFCSGDYSLYENWHGAQYATVSHSVSITNPGLLEFGFKVWLPDVSEQWNSGSGSHVTNLYVVIHSNTTDKNYSAGLWLYPSDSSYRAYLNGAYQAYPSCSSGTWLNLGVTLDPDFVPPCGPKGQGKILLNGTSLLSTGYNSADFPTIDSITIWSSFGDKQAVPEPSCVVALAVGLFVSGLRMRKKQGF
jgi:hypothetical protein